MDWQQVYYKKRRKKVNRDGSTCILSEDSDDMIKRVKISDGTARESGKVHL